MPSPFPGMNPYFERSTVWLDFHTEFLISLRRLLVPQVAPTYFVQLDEHVPREQDLDGIPFLQIRDREQHELITFIELLSPSSKRPGPDREQYIGKRRESLRSAAHLVEIDFLRGWKPMPAEGRPECDYSIMVSQAEKRRAADFWPVRLRERLPIIPIPMRHPDGAAS